jgi:O-antigen/teichoic acid export membrane protein
MRRELRFGGFVMSNGLVSMMNQNIPPLLIGRLLGISPLGLFQVANDVAKLPVRALLQPVARVSFPAMARLQGDLGRVSDFYLRITATLLFILLPVCWGLAVIAEEFVALVLGTKWEGAGPVLTAVSLFVPLRVLTRLMQSALEGIGRPEIALRNMLTITVCLVPAIVVGIRWGIVGAAIGWSVAQLPALCINLHRSLPVINISWGELLRRIGPGIVAAAAMYSGVWLARILLTDELPLLPATSILVGSGMLIYAGMTMLINRQVVKDALQWVRTRSL